MKMILRENALEAWASAIKYCEFIKQGKATLSNKKNFVASLQNAIELFIKQYMLNKTDYRVASVKELDENGEPLKQYLLSNNLNDYFASMNTEGMKSFYTLEFSKIIEYQKGLFKEYFDKNPGKEITSYLRILQRLRNNETHFYISNDFLSDSEFRDLFNLMTIFSEILNQYKLLPFWGEPFDENKRFSFKYEQLTTFSYKEQLKNNSFVQKLKMNIEKNEYPAGGGEEPYSIAEDLIAYTEEYTDKDFDELWEYVQALLEFKMLKIEDNTDENILDDGEQGLNAYREYSIVI